MLPLAPTRSSFWPNHPKVVSVVCTKQLEMAPMPFLPIWPGTTEVQRRAEQRRRLSCDDRKWSRDIDRCAKVTGLNAVVDGRAVRLGYSTHIDRPDAAGVTSGVIVRSMTLVVADVVKG